MLNVMHHLNASEKEYYLQQMGVNELCDAFAPLPYGLYVDSCMDLMHIEFLGNIKVHMSRLLWKMVRELQWTTLEELNARFLSFSHWGRGARPKSYILPEATFNGPIQTCSVSSLWTAHNMMLFLCYSIELLHIFIPSGDEDHPVWRCWCLHYQYVMICLQQSITLDNIKELDQLIYSQHELFINIYGDEDGAWHPKNHFAQHFPLDILKWGPLRLSWCMMFEHMNQVVKFSGLLSNFHNTLKSTSIRLAERLAFNLYCEKHKDFLKTGIHVHHEEVFILGMPNMSPTIMYLISTNQLGIGSSVTFNIQWISRIDISSSLVIRIQDYVAYSSLMRSDESTTNIACVRDMFHICGIVIMQMAVIMRCDTQQTVPPVPWSSLTDSHNLPIEVCEYIDVAQFSIRLLHPSTRKQTPNIAAFLCW